MPSYILRGIDDDLWRAFKARAAAEGRGLKYVVLRLVELYATVGLDKLEEAAKKATPIIVVALLLSACGGSSPLAPSMPPASTQVTVTGRITETQSGASVTTFTQTVDRLPAMVTVSAPGYVTRQTLIGSAAPTVDLINEAAPFDMGFYRQLVRNGYESTTLQPLAVLSANPSIYFQTTGLSASTVTAMEAAARMAIPALSGGRLSVATFTTGPESRAPSAGWIVVDLVNEPDANCGRSLVGALAGHIWLNTIERCRRNGTIVGSAPLFQHELGHAVGLYHVADAQSIMSPMIAASEPTASDRYHAAIAYHRQSGNRDPDIDSPTSTPLAVAAPMVIIN